MPTPLLISALISPSIPISMARLYIHNIHNSANINTRGITYNKINGLFPGRCRHPPSSRHQSTCQFRCPWPNNIFTIFVIVLTSLILEELPTKSQGQLRLPRPTPICLPILAQWHIQPMPTFWPIGLPMCQRIHWLRGSRYTVTVCWTEGLTTM